MLFGTNDVEAVTWRPRHPLRPNSMLRAEHGNTTKSDLVLISANITSWRKHADEVFRLHGDVVAIQEPRLTQMAAQKATTLAKAKGYTMINGKPIVSNPVRGKITTPDSCSQGGVAILAKNGACGDLYAAGASDMQTQQIYEKSRYARAAFAVRSPTGGSRFIHVASFYNEAATGAAAHSRKERMLARALEDCQRLGQQAAFLCTDSNLSRSQVLENALETASGSTWA